MIGMRFEAGISTQCSIPNYSAMVEMKVNVVACTVGWWILQSPPAGRTYHLPITAIEVYIPGTMSDLYGPADQAMADWTAALTNTGVSISRVLQPCGSGGACVNVVEGSVASGCAQSETGTSDTNGVATSPSTIKLPSAWTTRTGDRNRRTIAHELGHLLGLGDNSCSSTNSVMGPLACDATTGFSLLPTLTDKLPTTSSTYGNGVQKTCGS